MIKKGLTHDQISFGAPTYKPQKLTEMEPKDANNRLSGYEAIRKKVLDESPVITHNKKAKNISTKYYLYYCTNSKKYSTTRFITQYSKCNNKSQNI